MKKILIALLLVSGAAAAQQTAVNIIPKPQSLTVKPSSFTLSKATVIVARDEQDRHTATLLRDYLQQFYGLKLDIDRQEGKNYIRLTTKKFIQAPDKDAYSLDVTKDGIVIDGDTYAGTFYGFQTLVQLLPPQKAAAGQYRIPMVQVKDAPRFSYRGMHLDVSRHFFPVSFVKKYIDYLALHKLNYFHWHLTDDQGWRIQINRYPELTEVAGWRNGTIIGRYPGTSNNNTRYGGFYTQDEVREVVKYAADRFITVVPEIEMPGHASAAIAAYPWLSCFPAEPTKIPSHPSVESQRQQAAGRVKLVQETWGVFDDVFCAGKDSTFVFLQNVIDEILPLFPSRYIHVGGDECPKNNWKRCPNCQARIKAEGLKDEHELQSYFIQRMEKYLNGKGRVLIGWDEILEGGLAPNAIVMSWRGEKGGIEAAKQDHQVIMTPGSPLYFDHTQSKKEDSVVIGGYNPIEAVYAYDPVPKDLPQDKAKFIWGAQANLWNEYNAYPSKVEYMIFPRMAALSEVLWTEKAHKDWADFDKRLQAQFKRYDLWKVNYSKAYYDIRPTIAPAPGNKGVQVGLESRIKGQPIRYSITRKTDKADLLPKAYAKPVVITNSGVFEATIGSGNAVLNRWTQEFVFTRSTGKKATIVGKPNEKYPGLGGAFSLVNGVYSHKGLSFPDWLGFIGDDIDATIDLGSVQSIDSVRMHTINQNGSWVYLPEYVEVFVSADGKNFTSIGRSSEFRPDVLTMGWITVPAKQVKARYVRLFAKNYGLIPESKPGGGTKAWVFADEIQVF